MLRVADTSSSEWFVVIQLDRDGEKGAVLPAGGGPGTARRCGTPFRGPAGSSSAHPRPSALLPVLQQLTQPLGMAPNCVEAAGERVPLRHGESRTGEDRSQVLHALGEQAPGRPQPIA